MKGKNQRLIELVPITSLATKLQLRVRDIRNEENVRKWMYTDHMISTTEHLEWINNLKKDDRQIVFVILSEECIPLGVISINNIDYLHKKANWAYYLTQTERSGLGPSLEYFFVNFVFDNLKMEKLNCEVIEGNFTIVKLHKKFFFQEEGFRRSDIIRNGVRIGVHLLGLTKEDWLAGNAEIQENYSGIFEKFSITARWIFEN